MQFNISYVIRMPFVCRLYLLVCRSYVIHMLVLCACMLSVCIRMCVFIRISLVCTRVSSLCRLYLLVCHGMPPVCTRISSLCHPYILLYHPYVTRMYLHVFLLSLVYIRSMLSVYQYISRM